MWVYIVEGRWLRVWIIDLMSDIDDIAQLAVNLLDLFKRWGLLGVKK
jgi:hypothetical protein